MGGEGDDILDASPIVAAGLPTWEFFQTILLKGKDGNDSIQGSDLGDNIIGGAGDDTVDGAGGNDAIDGDSLDRSDRGADSLIGGDGDDSFHVGGEREGGDIELDGGTDTVRGGGRK